MKNNKIEIIGHGVLSAQVSRKLHEAGLAVEIVEPTDERLFREPPERTYISLTPGEVIPSLYTPPPTRRQRRVKERRERK